MTQGLMLNFSPDAPSLFFFIRPMVTKMGTIDRMCFYVCVPTETLCLLLTEEVQNKDNAERVTFYSALVQHADTSQAAGYIYEFCFHGFLCTDGQMGCQWLAKGAGHNMAKLPTMLSGTGVLAPATLDALPFQTPPYYWIAPNKFPGIDSAIVLETESFVFQTTLAAQHGSPIEGLKKLRTKLPKNLKSGLCRSKRWY